MNTGIDTKYIDSQIKPEDDFYQFVNGGWLANTEIPADRSSWGSFHELAKATDEKVLQLLQKELQTEGPATNKAARLFETGMNLAQIEGAKLTALQPTLEKISGFNEPSKLPFLLGRLISEGLGAIIHFGVHPDMGDSSIYTCYIEAGQTGLPERDFYLDDDAKAQDIRAAYQSYIQQLLTEEAGYPAAEAPHIAEWLLNFEQELARHMMSKEDRRQMDLLYNPFTIDELRTNFRDFDWDLFYKGAGIDSPSRVIVTDVEYFRYVSGYLATLSPDLIRHYLTFICIHHAAPFAHQSLDQSHFNLFSKKLEGVEVMRPRSERIVKIINHYLGEALGELFVSAHFPPGAKETALEMTGDIVTAFSNRIKELDWMNESTKKYALEKLSSFKVKIGYPDKWKDYHGLELTSSDDEGSYLENLLAVVRWKFKEDAERIGKNVDKDEWFMAPQVVNAYYNPMFNEIVFPAAILQPPFFDWRADAAVNYGGIGAVIGHEITHGFDDQGSRFDKEGNLNEWWTPEDRERFSSRTRQLVEQFEAYYPFDDLPLNGTFTLGENIADLGGLSVAYDALQLYFKRHGRPEPIDGFTAEQRFFMSWATIWRTKIRPEALRTQIKTDPHPPGMYRAIAAPSNLHAFYKAFPISPQSQWHRSEEKRIKIW